MRGIVAQSAFRQHRDVISFAVLGHCPAWALAPGFGWGKRPAARLAMAQRGRLERVAMWYVVQVTGGREQSVLEKIQHQVSPETYESCFVPRFEARKRISGQWKTKTDVLFPGYVFVDTRTPQRFRVELNKVSAMTKLLCGKGEDGNPVFMPLTDDEKTLISALIGQDDHVLRMSEGIIEGDSVRVLRGPLRGYEMLVKKIDRHKRVAYLCVDMLGRQNSVKVGLEIVEKR